MNMMLPCRVFFTIFNRNVHLIQNQEFGRYGHGIGIGMQQEIVCGPH